MELTFEWDEEKAKKNLRDHKVSFEEAKTVFNDPFLMTYPDPDHSEEEQRYLSIGCSSTGRILIVVRSAATAATKRPKAKRFRAKLFDFVFLM
jgi:hypothetical protein